MSQGSVFYMLAGTVETTYDSSLEISAELFAPFPTDTFPARLDRLQLTQLLNESPPVKVPVRRSGYHRYQQMCPDLFKPDDSRNADALASRLAVAFQEL